MSDIKTMTPEEFERYTKLRVEFSSYGFRKLLEENYEKKCVNCLSDKGVEFHHIVPLSEGGTNRLTNIVPLCLACHDAYHIGRNRGQYAGRIVGRTGRFTKIPYEKAKPYFDRFFRGEIGAGECMRLLGYTGGTHMADLAVFKKYKDEKHIVDYKNNIDIKAHNGKLKINDEIGYVEYSDGRVEKIYYRPQFIKTGKFNQLEFNF